MRLTLRELNSKGFIWNKERIKVVYESDDGEEQIESRIDRIEFLQEEPELENLVLEWFEPLMGIYRGSSMPILVLHMIRPEKKDVIV